MKFLLISPYFSKKPQLLDAFKNKYPVFTLKQFLGPKVVDRTYALYDYTLNKDIKEIDELLNNVDFGLYCFSPTLKDRKYENEIFNSKDFLTGYKTIYMKPDLYKLMAEMRKNNISLREIFDRFINFYEICDEQIGASYIDKKIFNMFCSDIFNSSADYFYEKIAANSNTFFIKPKLICDYKDRGVYFDMVMMSDNVDEQVFNLARIFKHFNTISFDWSTIPNDQNFTNYKIKKGIKVDIFGGGKNNNIILVVAVLFLVILIIYVYFEYEKNTTNKILIRNNSLEKL